MQTEIVMAEFSGASPDFAPSGHTDTFPRDNLPPRHLWPELAFELDDYKYPQRLNCAVEFLDRNLESGRGDHVALISPEETLTYSELLDRVNRICNVLVGDLGMVPGNRVMLRSANNNWVVATYLAVLKAGGVVVATRGARNIDLSRVPAAETSAERPSRSVPMRQGRSHGAVVQRYISSTCRRSQGKSASSSRGVLP